MVLGKGAKGDPFKYLAGKVTNYLGSVLRVLCSAVTVLQLVITPWRLNVANQGRGCFLYILKIFAFSLMTASSHARFSAGVVLLCVVAES
jgi:hypothetical protein